MSIKIVTIKSEPEAAGSASVNTKKRDRPSRWQEDDVKEIYKRSANVSSSNFDSNAGSLSNFAHIIPSNTSGLPPRDSILTNKGINHSARDSKPLDDIVSPAVAPVQQLANFGLSGALAKDKKSGNVVNGVTLKWSEPMVRT